METHTPNLDLAVKGREPGEWRPLPAATTTRVARWARDAKFDRVEDTLTEAIGRVAPKGYPRVLRVRGDQAVVDRVRRWMATTGLQVT